MWRWWPGGRQPSDRGVDPIAREKERALKLFGEQPAEDLHPYAPPPGPVHSGRAADNRPPPHTLQMTLVAIGILSGAMLGLLLLADDPDGVWKDARNGFVAVSGGMGYMNCAHVRLVGAAPLKKGDKGYSKALDVDGNGIACEPLIKSDEPATAATDTRKKKRG
jgi:hypothetical protein